MLVDVHVRAATTEDGRTFDDVASEESLQTAVYGQLLREQGWMVDDRTTNRPRLLVSMPSTTGARPR
ncbi:hypothetical protein AB0N09_27985 [Streptomyces erythrochromogenes]|uniref:hypothetical protein n=1 Tax=Streptomyces erythrochromogenes TaxID=285574 RepID=UPI00342E7E24